MDLSVIVPAYNEEKNLEPLIAETKSVLDATGMVYEIIVVDDGSTDGTYALLTRLSRQEARLRAVCLKRNFGQTAAMAAGFAHSRGDVIVAMDGDRQNDPRDIPTLLKKLEEGYDLVCGWRFPREDPFWSRRLPSRCANGLISWITRVKLHDYGCTLKAMRKEIARDLKLYGEMHRFIPAVAYERGARIAELQVRHRPRSWGRSKYGIARTFRVVLDLLTVKFLLSYSTRPLHIFGLLGLVSGSVGFLTAVHLTVQKLFYGVDIGGRPLLLVSVLLIVIGVQFISMGLLGEMLARTYHESQDKPVYVIKEIVEGGPEG
jgi:glycosyltransferase involved in cell wall biosynthesis